MDRSIEKQTVQAAYVVFCIGMACLALSYLSGCGKYEQGLIGPQGVQGQVGAPGANCTVVTVLSNSIAPNGGSLIQCPDGSKSLVLNGATGVQGPQGVQGQTGIPGAADTNGTIVTPVQFCKGADSYPSTFVEVGFCLNNKLYGVYSSNGGFLTEVLPGTWSSNGINSSCTFTVGPNCQVSN